MLRSNGLHPTSGGSTSASVLSGPAQASLTLRPARSPTQLELGPCPWSFTARVAPHDVQVATKMYRQLLGPDFRRLFIKSFHVTPTFEYGVEELHMSESEAYLRIHAARLGRRFPLVVELLAQGSLHLTAIKLLGPQLTDDNHVQLLERARGKSKRGIEQLLAEIAPRPDVPNRMRKLPELSASRSPTTSVEAGSAPQLALASEKVQPSDASQTPLPSKRRALEPRPNRSAPAATSWNSPPDKRCTTNSSSSKTCYGIRSRMATWPCSSSVQWTC
jgi:hypothetical protein